MSSARFASMTASLFSRDGHSLQVSEPASPTNLFSIPQRSRVEVKTTPAVEKAKVSRRRPPRDTDRLHKVRISLSDAEFAAFGIAAVKRSATRNQVLRHALNFYLDKLAVDYGKTCACLASVPGKGPCHCAQ